MPLLVLLQRGKTGNENAAAMLVVLLLWVRAVIMPPEDVVVVHLEGIVEVFPEGMVVVLLPQSMELPGDVWVLGEKGYSIVMVVLLAGELAKVLLMNTLQLKMNTA